MSYHIGRSFVGHRLEDKCPCPQEPCGLVDERRVAPDCSEHALGRAKTIRQIHRATECPKPSNFAAEAAVHFANGGSW